MDQDGKGKGREDDKGKGREGKQTLKAARIVKGSPGEEEEEWEGSVAQAGKVYNYVVTAQKPTAVTHSVVGNFTDPDGFLFLFLFLFFLFLSLFNPIYLFHFFLIILFRLKFDYL